MKHTIMKMIVETLNRLEMFSPEACQMVYRTGMAESGFRALEQTGGPALGFFQCEPATIQDCWENFIIYRKDLTAKFYALGFREDDMDFSVLSNIALQIAFCRIKYRRDSEPIPSKLQSQAVYWKRIYNSELGKGTVEHFMDANKE